MWHNDRVCHTEHIGDAAFELDNGVVMSGPPRNPTFGTNHILTKQTGGMQTLTSDASMTLYRANVTEPDYGINRSSLMSRVPASPVDFDDLTKAVNMSHDATNINRFSGQGLSAKFNTRQPKKMTSSSNLTYGIFKHKNKRKDGSSSRGANVYKDSMVDQRDSQEMSLGARFSLGGAAQNQKSESKTAKW